MKPDTIDTANELAQARIDQAVANMRIDRNAVSATHCEACGEVIPEPRRIAVLHCKTCMYCQYEKKGEKKRDRNWVRKPRRHPLSPLALIYCKIWYKHHANITK